MENQSISEVSSKCHLPEELCLDIISRLPVKSLVRFRCVSKSWLSMITHPDFCHLHLKNFSNNNNHNESHLLVVQGRSQHCVVRCSDTFESTETLFTLRSLPHSHGEGSWSIKYSANGLFLLEKSSGRDCFKVLCNPSIRKFRDIPSSPNSSFNEADIGLGYDPSGKDYKYVKLIRENPNIPPMVAIYTLGPDSWKIIPFQGKGFSEFEWEFESIRYLEMTLCIRGILYFLAIRMETDVWELVSFDLTREVFDFIDLPDDVAHISRHYFDSWVKLVRYGCSTLAVFPLGDHMSMWVLEIESMCWTVPYSLWSLDFDAPEFLYLKKNRDILLRWSKETSFSLATGNRLEQWRCSLVSSYNLQTRKEKILMMQKENADFEIENVYAYIESMALLK